MRSTVWLSINDLAIKTIRGLTHCTCEGQFGKTV